MDLKILPLVLAILAILGCAGSGSQPADAGHVDSTFVDASTPQLFGAGTGNVFPVTVNGVPWGFTPNMDAGSCGAGFAFGSPGGMGWGCVPTSGTVGFDGSAGALTNANPLGENVDINSIVWGDPSQPELPAFTGYPLTTSTPFVQPNVVAATTPDLYGDAVLVNSTAIATPLAQKFYFTAPANVTGVDFSAVMALPSGVASTTVVMQVQSSAGTMISTVTCTLGAYATCHTGNTTVTPGTTYIGAFLYNQGASSGVPAAEALIARYSIIPTTTTNPVLTTPFARYNIRSWDLWDNSYDYISEVATQGVYRNQMAQSRYVFKTNATSIGIQTYNAGGADPVVVNVNDRFWTSFLPANNAYGLNTVALPVSAGLTNVEIVSGGGGLSAGVYLTSVIAPQTAVFQPQGPTATTGNLVFFGDSKCEGFGATNPGATSLVPVLRRLTNFEVFNDCASGATLYLQAGIVPSYLNNLVSSIVRSNPVVIIDEIGVNDWSNAYQSLAAYTTLHGQFLDALHAAAPYAQIFKMTTSTEDPSVESTPNANGDLLSSYRGAEAALCNAASRTLWCTVIPGDAITGWNTSTMLFGTIHPNNLGYSVQAAFILKYIEFVNNGSPPAGWSNAMQLFGDVIGYPNQTVVQSLTGVAGIVSAPAASIAFGIDPSTTGFIRCPNNQMCVSGRDSSNTVNIPMAYVDSSNNLQIGGTLGPSSTFVQGQNGVSVGTSAAHFNILNGSQTGQGVAGTTTTLFAPAQGVGTSALLFRDEAWGGWRTVSTATPAVLITYALPSGSSAHAKVRTVCRAVTAPSGGSIGDTWATESAFGARNVGGTATIVGTLSALDTFTDTSMSTTAVTATVSGADIVYSVANVATATVDCESNMVILLN